MSDDVFGPTFNDESLPDWTGNTPQAGDSATTEVAPEPTGVQPQPEGDQPGGTGLSERPRDEKGRFVKADEQPAPQETTPGVALTEDGVHPSGVAPDDQQPREGEEKVWAGKYQSPEQLEKGYRELRDLQRRTAERAKAYEQRVEEVQFQARQMEDAVRRATEYVRSLQQQPQQQQQQTPLYDQWGNPVQLPQQQPGLSPDQVQPMVESMLEQRLAAEAQARQEQEWRLEQYNNAKAAQDRFFETHPDIVRNDTVDEDVANTILAFNEAWSDIDGSSFNLGSDESYEIAYEASRRPALRAVLEKQPQLMDDDDGMTLARALANQIDGGGTTQAASQATRMTPRQGTPVVERGSSPAPQQGSPLDEFDQAVAEYRGIAKNRGSDVFFGE